MKKSIFILACVAVSFSLNACKTTQKIAETTEITDSVAATPEQTSAGTKPTLNSLLVGKRWTLTELNGKPYEGKIEAFIVLNDSTNQVSGNLGCNSFFGTYELKVGNRITFSGLASTRKMCLDVTVEEEMKRVLEIADNYNVDNNTLMLNRARMAPLAKFSILTK